MKGRQVYLFQCGDTDRYALSVDKTGCNIPRPESRTNWLLRAELFDMRELDLEQPLREVERRGYCYLLARPSGDL